MTQLIINGLTEEQWAFARAVAGEVDRLRARLVDLEVKNGQLAGYLSTAEDNANRYREALELIADIDPDYMGTFHDIANAALGGEDR